MKKITLLVVLALAFFAIGRFSAAPETVATQSSRIDAETATAANPESSSKHTTKPSSEAVNKGRAALADAYTRRLQDVPITASGRVLKVLPDDNQGSRHQRFLLDSGLGHSLLVAHNIDLAPRIPDLQRGDLVEFQGEYVWNEKGGVIHWTHHDPDGTHSGGWLKHNGRTYE